MTTLRQRVLDQLRPPIPHEPRSRAVTCGELMAHLKRSHQSVSAALAHLRRDGLVYVSGKRENAEGRLVNAYRRVYDLATAQGIDCQCGRGNVPHASREAVVEYLARVSDDEWDAILREAAAKSG